MKYWLKLSFLTFGLALQAVLGVAQKSCWQSLLTQAQVYIKSEKFVQAQKVLSAAKSCPDRPSNYAKIITDLQADSEKQTTEAIDKKNENLMSQLSALSSARDSTLKTAQKAQELSEQSQLNGLINIVESLEAEDPSMALDLLRIAFETNNRHITQYRFRELALRILHSQARPPATQIVLEEASLVKPLFLKNKPVICFVYNNKFLKFSLLDKTGLEDEENFNPHLAYLAHTVRVGDAPIADMALLDSNKIAVVSQERCLLLDSMGKEITSFSVPDRDFNNIEVSSDGNTIYLSDQKNMLLEKYDWTGRCILSVENLNSIKTGGIRLNEAKGVLISQLNYESGYSESRLLATDLNFSPVSLDPSFSRYKAATFNKRGELFALSDRGKQTQLVLLDSYTGQVMEIINTELNGSFTDIEFLDNGDALLCSETKILLLDSRMRFKREYGTMFSFKDEGFCHASASDDGIWTVSLEKSNKAQKRLRVWSTNGLAAKIHLNLSPNTWFTAVDIDANNFMVLASGADSTIYSMLFDGTIRTQLKVSSLISEVKFGLSPEIYGFKTLNNTYGLVQDNLLVHSMPYQNYWQAPLQVNATHFLLQSSDKELSIWDLQSKKILKTIQLEGQIKTFKYYPEKQNIWVLSQIPNNDKLELACFDFSSQKLLRKVLCSKQVLDFDIWQNRYCLLQNSLDGFSSEVLINDGDFGSNENSSDCIYLENLAKKIGIISFKTEPILTVQLENRRAESYNLSGKLLNYFDLGSTERLIGASSDASFYNCYLITSAQKQGLTIWHHDYLERSLASPNDKPNEAYPIFSLEERCEAGYIPSLAEIEEYQDPLVILQGLKYYSNNSQIKKEYSKKDLNKITNNLKTLISKNTKEQLSSPYPDDEELASTLADLYAELATFCSDSAYNEQYLKLLYHHCLKNNNFYKESLLIFETAEKFSSVEIDRLYAHYAKMLLQTNDVEILEQYLLLFNRNTRQVYPELEKHFIERVLAEDYLYKINFNYKKLIRTSASRAIFDQELQKKIEVESSPAELTNLFGPAVASGDEDKVKIIFQKMKSYIEQSESEYSLGPLYYLESDNMTQYSLIPVLNERLLQIAIQRNDWTTSSYVLARFEKFDNSEGIQKLQDFMYSQVPSIKELLVLEALSYLFKGQPERLEGVSTQYMNVLRQDFYPQETFLPLIKAAIFFSSKQDGARTGELLAFCHKKALSSDSDTLMFSCAKSIYLFRQLSMPQLLPQIYFYTNSLLEKALKINKKNNEAANMLKEVRIAQLVYVMDTKNKSDVRKISSSLLKTEPSDVRVQVLVATAYMTIGDVKQGLALCKAFQENLSGNFSGNSDNSDSKMEIANDSYQENYGMELLKNLKVSDTARNLFQKSMEKLKK